MEYDDDSSGDSNRVRIAFREVCGLEAWHAPFSDRSRIADLHINVGFQTGRLGGEDASAVRFKMSIKRAEVRVIIPRPEPVDIVPATIRREFGSFKAVSKEKRQRQSKFDGRVAVAAKAGTKGAGVDISAGVQAKHAVIREQSVKINEDLTPIVPSNMPRHDGTSWKLEPETRLQARDLQGVGWDAATAMLQLKARAAKSPPTVRVEVVCLREDLRIEDIQIKGDKLDRFNPLDRNRLAAAEAYIRGRLVAASLSKGSVSDPYAEITLSSLNPKVYP